MSSSFEKSVKGATKLKLAPPKAKYIEHILQATRSGEAGVAEVFRVLQFRIRDSTWTIAFKALIVVHLMIREGAPNVTLAYVSSSPTRIIGVNQYTDVQTQGKNIRHYSRYLIERARAFQKARCDYVQQGAGRLKKLSIDKGLLKETEGVQEQIKALLKCDFLTDDVENEISITAYRLLTQDLLALYQVMNEGTMNVLERYFEMSRPDAERALAIYKVFTLITDLVIRHLAVARQFEHVLRIEIPKLKHAPTSLGSALEDYLNDRDFETNRRQYLGQLEAKRSGIKPSASSAATMASKPVATGPNFPSGTSKTNTTITQQPKGPDPDLIDFFESIEQNQQPMAQQPEQYQQQTFVPAIAQQQAAFAPQPVGYTSQQTGFNSVAAFAPQQTTNPFGQFQQPPTQAQPQQQFQQQQQQQSPPQIQTQFTGAGFGGYTPQPQAPPQHFTVATDGPQTSFSGSNQFPQVQQQAQAVAQPSPGGLQRQATNPFRQSTIASPTAQSSSPFGQSPTHGRSNPFAKVNTILEESAMQSFSAQPFPPSQSGSPFSQQPQSSGSPFSANQTQSPQSLVPQHTGTNPFARTQPTSPPAAADKMQAQATGTTNPFRQSTFINENTGQGWQNGPQGTVGGLPAQTFDTVPVFPRPAGQMGGGFGQQQQQHQQWG